MKQGERIKKETQAILVHYGNHDIKVPLRQLGLLTKVMAMISLDKWDEISDIWDHHLIDEVKELYSHETTQFLNGISEPLYNYDLGRFMVVNVEPDGMDNTGPYDTYKEAHDYYKSNIDNAANLYICLIVECHQMI